jgi:hypothetical protein
VDFLEDFTWRRDWFLGAGLTVVTFLFHVMALAAVARLYVLLERYFPPQERVSMFRAAAVIAPVVALVFLLHAAQALLWAWAYVAVEALPHWREAVLYSLGAMATYGHAPIYLAPDWQLLGAIQALAGMLVFGISTAFLVAMVRRAGAHHEL